jgi:hypothetical protein
MVVTTLATISSRTALALPEFVSYKKHGCDSSAGQMYFPHKPCGAVLEISTSTVRWYKCAWILSPVARAGHPAWIKGPYVPGRFDTGNGVH